MSKLKSVVELQDEDPPKLLVVVHTEEEFDWSAPFDRNATAVTHLSELGRVQEIFARYNARPTYVVDYPVASQDAGIAAVSSALSGTGGCIGAHLHPWVNPPFDEVISTANSYPGNLPRDLEKEKLRQLTERITEGFGRRPVVYLAGRYGFGLHSLSILQELEYRIDLSAVALTSFQADGGPDFRAWDNQPRWDGRPPIFRIPHNVVDVGFLCRNGKRLFEPDRGRLFRALHLPGIMARCGGIVRVRLTPEGFSLRHLKIAARTLLAAGTRILLFSFHSPSVASGFTPYVRDKRDQEDFFSRIDGFLRFFCQELDGNFATPEDILQAGTLSNGSGP